MVKVSASMVTYNNEKYVKDAIGTLLDSVKDPNIDFRLYIFDNASTDNTMKIIEENFINDPRVFVMPLAGNIGFGAGHNKMFPIFTLDFKSDYHCVVNADVVIKDDIVSDMVNYMEAHKDVVQLSPRICFPDGRDQILGKKNPHIWYLASSRLRSKTGISPLLKEYAMLDKGIEQPFEIENATGCFMFFRTHDFRRVGGFDQRYFMYFEDCDITRKLTKRGKVLYYPHAIVYHVWARDSKRNANLMLIHIHSMFKYYLKWRTI